MNTASINEINTKLKLIPDIFATEILDYLEFIHNNNNNYTEEYILTEEQLKLLDTRSKTPLEDCISEEDFMKNLKSKFNV